MMFYELLHAPVSPSTSVQDAVYRTDQCRQNSLPLGLVFCRLQRPAKPQMGGKTETLLTSLPKGSMYGRYLPTVSYHLPIFTYIYHKTQSFM